MLALCSICSPSTRMYVLSSCDVCILIGQDGYKIVSFVPDTWGIDGRRLDPVCRSPGDINRVSDVLLRWHYRQSVLVNMQLGRVELDTLEPDSTQHRDTLSRPASSGYAHG